MLILGRKDIVSFPDFQLMHVPVKVDTGAYSSSIHCHSIELIWQDGHECLKVTFLDPTTHGYTGDSHTFTEFKRKAVKSSNGIAEERFFVKGAIRLFNKRYETLFSLTERTGLRNPVLIGRRLLNKRFLVDTSKVNCSFNFEHKQQTND